MKLRQAWAGARAEGIPVGVVEQAVVIHSCILAALGLGTLRAIALAVTLALLWKTIKSFLWCPGCGGEPGIFWFWFIFSLNCSLWYHSATVPPSTINSLLNSTNYFLSQQHLSRTLCLKQSHCFISLLWKCSKYKWENYLIRLRNNFIYYYWKTWMNTWQVGPKSNQSFERIQMDSKLWVKQFCT